MSLRGTLFVTKQSFLNKIASLPPVARNDTCNTIYYVTIGFRMNTPQKIQDTLRAKLFASHVEVLDQSHLHAGHKQAQESGGGHYTVIVAAEIFTGKKTLVRHRLVYQALAKEFQTEIHALSVRAYSLEEYRSSSQGSAVLE